MSLSGRWEGTCVTADGGHFGVVSRFSGSGDVVNVPSRPLSTALGQKLKQVSRGNGNKRGGSLIGDAASASDGAGSESDGTDVEEPSWEHQQDFVKVRLEPGEWDLTKTNPLYRPAWKGKAKIMSAEDFDNRPRGGFDEEFESLHDAMGTVSWLSRKQTDAIYQFYLDTMTSMAASSKATSHEYVMRLVGQKFEITALRAAAIVQLHHNEDQFRQQYPEEEIFYDLQDEVDAIMEKHVRGFYEAHFEHFPGQFLEDATEPIGSPYRKSSACVSVEDHVDLEAVRKRTILKDKERAQRMIDNTLYIEDNDQTQIPVKLSASSKALIEAYNAIVEQGRESKYLPSPEDDSEMTLPENGRGHRGASHQRRPRWKYVGQLINTLERTKDKKKRRKKARQGTSHHMTVEEVNTVVEHDGVLRPATVDEVYKTSWKPKRHDGELAYRGVKQAWLERTLNGKVGGWGRVEVVEREEEAAPKTSDIKAEFKSDSSSEPESESESESEYDSDFDIDSDSDSESDDLEEPADHGEEIEEAPKPDEPVEDRERPEDTAEPQTEADSVGKGSSNGKDT